MFFAMAYYTGMRKGEINALKWSDIDVNIIHVRRSIAQKLKGPDRGNAAKIGHRIVICKPLNRLLKYWRSTSPCNSRSTATAKISAFAAGRHV